MPAPFCFSDDVPEPHNRPNQLSTVRLRRERDDLHNLTGDVVRMLEGFRAGDSGFTGAGTRLTLAATLNALEGWIHRAREVEAEMLPVKPLPLAKPFGRRRIPDASLPATVSPGALA